jgi:ribosomal-protein-alanine N-acetyltransferase
VDFSLRDFRREDFEKLWSIDQRCFPPGISYTRLELKFYMHRRGAFTLVAEKADPEVAPETVGFIVAEAGRGGVGHIITIDVLPAVRRFGVGSRLLTAAEDRLRAAHCHGVFLETAVDNKPALSFYKRHRYFVLKTVPRYYSNGLDAFVLQKDLLTPEEGS